jgi:hypothetical protein
VHPLFGGVVQIPGDPPPLGLEREPFRSRLLAAELSQRVGRVGERERDEPGDHEVRGQRLDSCGGPYLAQVEAQGNRHAEVAGGVGGSEHQRATERQRRGRQHERGEAEQVERAAPVLRCGDQRQDRRGVGQPRRRRAPSRRERANASMLAAL